MTQPTSVYHVSRDPMVLHDVREWLVAELTARSGLGRDRISDAVMMVNELATNVLVHTKATGEVHLDITATSVRIEVRDQSGHVPVMRPADPTRVGGQGLRIVDGWSSEWGISRNPDGGKVVWICLEV